jgi:mRNA interferase MazF
VESSNHKNNALIDTAKQIYNNLRGLIDNTAITTKVKESYLKWLQAKTEMLTNEKIFDPRTLPYYKRGEVILANFGFNVGEEYGGNHYAIVLRDSRESQGKILVLPITSQEPKSKHLPIYIEIGSIIGLTKHKHHWANILNITNISKQRIIVTTKSLNVNSRVLDRISGAVVSQIALRKKN